MTRTDPIIVERACSPRDATVLMRIPQDLDYLRGHFPGAPLVPGVVQIKWAVDEGVACFACSKDVVGLKVVKFNRTMRPLDEVVLTLKLDDEQRRLDFTYSSDAGTYSSGRLMLKSSS